LRGSAPRAATLAAVTIGTDVGIFDERLLSATLVVLVTVIVSGIVTRSAARRFGWGQSDASAWDGRGLGFDER
jgi:hypothetical protein